ANPFPLPGPCVFAEISGYATGSAPPGLAGNNAVVTVFDSVCNPTANSAFVFINGVALTHLPGPGIPNYVGNVAMGNAGDAVTLTVVTETGTYTASTSFLPVATINLTGGATWSA